MALDESQGIADEAEAITPSDATQFLEKSVLYIGTTGNVTVDMLGGGTAITFTNVFGGTFLPILVSRVYATGTTATNIVRMF